MSTTAQNEQSALLQGDDSKIWQVDSPLPSPGQTILLEASAGTGKTWQISTIYARLVVCEGVKVEEILAMTFTKAATAELGERIRKRLEEAAALLNTERPWSTQDQAQWPSVLCTLSLEELKTLEQIFWAEGEDRKARFLKAQIALGMLDQASISTIHSFSQQMLRLFAFESGQDPDLEVMAQIDRLIDEAVADAEAWALRMLKDEPLIYGWVKKQKFDTGALKSLASLLMQSTEPQFSPQQAQVLKELEPLSMEGRWQHFLNVAKPKFESLQAKVEDFRSWWRTPVQSSDDPPRYRYQELVDKYVSDFTAHPWLKGSKYQENYPQSSTEKVDKWFENFVLRGGIPLDPKESKENYSWITLSRAEIPTKDKARHPPEKLVNGKIDFSEKDYRDLLEKSDHFFRDYQEDYDQFITELYEPTLIFAAGLREKLMAQLEELGLISFNSMISSLAEKIDLDPSAAGSLCARIQEKYKVALIDEFQDTDGAQWKVLRTVFGTSPDHRMILIGDPKQAIYAFRGADVFVYLDAIQSAQDRYTMETNWRSDGAYIEAMNRLWLKAGDPFELHVSRQTQGSAGALQGREGEDVSGGVQRDEWVNPTATAEQEEPKHSQDHSGEENEEFARGGEAPAEPSPTVETKISYVKVKAAKEWTRIAWGSESWLDQFENAERESTAEPKGAPRLLGGPGTTDGAIDTDDTADKNKPKREPRPLEWVLFHRKETKKGEMQQQIAAHLAQRVVHLLLAGKQGAQIEDRPLQPSDFAVLVDTHKEGALIKKALLRHGLRAITTDNQSVFQAQALSWLVTWLRAIAGRGQDREAQLLAVSPLIGWNAYTLRASLQRAEGLEEGHSSTAGVAEGEAQSAQAAPPADSTDWAAWCLQLDRWGRAYERGFMTLFDRAMTERRVFSRLLARPEGERHCSDLRQLAELCQMQLTEQPGLGPLELARWLEASQAGGEKDESGDEGHLPRLESDAQAVRIVTIHASKGLEYPIVLLPFLWSATGKSAETPYIWHDPQDPTRPMLQLCKLGAIEESEDGSKGSKSRSEESEDGARKIYQMEDRQERMRKLYVALTRAKHHAMVWFGRCYQVTSWKSAVGRLLDKAAGDPAADTHAIEALDKLNCEQIGYSPLPDFPLKPVSYQSSEETLLQSRRWGGREILRSSERTESFTSLSQRAQRSGDAPVLDEISAWDELPALDEVPALDEALSDEEPLFDEAQQAALWSVETQQRRFEPAQMEGEEERIALAFEGEEPSERAQVRGLPSHLEGFPGGPTVGSWVHGVFEKLDFKTLAEVGGGDLEALIEREALAQGLRPSPQVRAQLAQALPRILSTPFWGADGLTTPLSLGQITLQSRLAELRFDLRMEAPEGGAPLPDLVREALSLRLGDRKWSGHDWLQHVCAQKVGLFTEKMRGSLTGAIDLIFRHPQGAEARYYLADYKSNRIFSREIGASRDSLWMHYSEPWMAHEMARHGYHFQALIYTLALHRHLKLRLANYDYDRHVGGHLYLFVRGMQGPQRSDRGVYFDRWPKAVVEAFDEALGGSLLRVAS